MAVRMSPMSTAEKLTRLRSSAQEVNDFLLLIHPGGGTYHYRPIDQPGREWPRAKQEQLSLGEILNHLLDRGRWISTDRVSPDGFVRHFVLDVDAHDMVAQSALPGLVADIRAALPFAHMIVRSSPSGGVHLYYFLAEPVPFDEVRQLLRHLPRGVELFPRPGKQFLRAPFGKDSAILDDQLRVADVNPATCVRVFLAHAAQKNLPTFADVLAVAAVRWPTTAAPARRQPTTTRQTGPVVAIDQRQCQRWLTEGLTEPDSRNEAGLVMVRYFYRQGVRDVDGLGERLWVWLEEAHNGQSDLVAKNPAAARQWCYDLARREVKYRDGRPPAGAITFVDEDTPTAAEWTRFLDFHVRGHAVDWREMRFLTSWVRYLKARRRLGHVTPVTDRTGRLAVPISHWAGRYRRKFFDGCTANPRRTSYYLRRQELLRRLGLATLAPHLRVGDDCNVFEVATWFLDGVAGSRR